MSRRWIPRRTEPDTADQPAAESVEQALITSVTTNRFLRDQLHDTKVALGLKTRAVERLERRAGSLAHRLETERDHTAGSCSHAAELRELKGTLAALEKRVAELQRVNEGYESPGWMPRADSAALKRLGRRVTP